MLAQLPAGDRLSVPAELAGSVTIASFHAQYVCVACGAEAAPVVDAIANAAQLASQPSRPMDNTDFGLVWRKRVTRDFVTYALRELRGDDVRELRRGIARQELLASTMRA